MSFYSNIFFLILWFLTVQHDFVSFRNERTLVNKTADKLEVTLFFSIEPGYHIQDHEEVPDQIIPTSISFEPGDHYSRLKYEFIIPAYDSLVLDKTPLRVISDEFKVKVILDLLNMNSESPTSLEGSLKYQACDDRQCFFPREITFEVYL